MFSTCTTTTLRLRSVGRTIGSTYVPDRTLCQLKKNNRTTRPHEKYATICAVSKCNINNSNFSRKITKRSLVTCSAVSPELIAGVSFAGIAGLVGGLAVFLKKADQEGTELFANKDLEYMPEEEEQRIPENAVLVFGASGKTGREVVAELLKSGRQVIAAVRDADKMLSAFSELQAGPLELTNEQAARLFIRGGVDITSPETLNEDLFQGATQVVTTLGPIFGSLPDGGFGYFDNMTSERVDKEGVSNVVAAAMRLLPEGLGRKDSEVLMQQNSEDSLARWVRLDDVIMGGNSQSAWSFQEGDAGAVWAGELVVEGGGFCGTRTAFEQDLSGYDGVSLRVKGDGQRYKINIKTKFNENMPEFTYQAAFDTVADDWTTISLPFSSFLAVVKGNEMRSAPPLSPADITSMSLIFSRFEFNGLPNLNAKPGPFSLALESIQAFRDPRPLLVHMSTGGVERNARILTEEDRKNCVMPIVQLNPGGALNWKYAGETAVRNSGLPYTVVRSAGLVSLDLDKDFLLQANQGDTTVGKVSRGEVAEVLAAALGDPAALGKTFEVRRGDEETIEEQQNMRRMFLGLARDSQRGMLEIPPFPAPGPPMGMPDDSRKQEILKDDRVQESLKRGDGGRVRDAADAPADTEKVTNQRVGA